MITEPRFGEQKMLADYLHVIHIHRTGAPRFSSQRKFFWRNAIYCQKRHGKRLIFPNENEKIAVPMVQRLLMRAG